MSDRWVKIDPERGVKVCVFCGGSDHPAECGQLIAPDVARVSAMRRLQAILLALYWNHWIVPRARKR